MAEILIDTNAYLDFYRAPKMLAAFPLIEGLRDHISVSKQVVDEFERHKLAEAIRALDVQFAGLDVKSSAVPELKISDVFFNDNRFKVVAENISKLRDLRSEIAKLGDRATGVSRNIQDDLNKLRAAIVVEVVQSQDIVSKELGRLLWGKARDADQGELGRARVRLERGNPPGKRTGVLGDQLIWEQFLSDLTETDTVWIVSRDGDYFDGLDGKRILNPLLAGDLYRKLGHVAEVREFKDIETGLNDFAATRGIATDKRLSPQQIAEIEAEKNEVDMQEPSLDEQIIAAEKEFYEASAAQLQAEQAFGKVRQQFPANSLEYVEAQSKWTVARGRTHRALHKVQRLRGEPLTQF